jgi:hypothetical protein
MIARIVTTTAFSVCIVTSVHGQDRPDFSGRWAIAQPAPPQGAGGGRGGRGPTGDMGSGWGNPITITQDATRLTVEYAFFGRGDMQPPLRFVYALDGSETKHIVRMGRGPQDQSSRTAWDGNRLVITTRHAFPNPDTGAPMNSEVKRVLSLTADSLIVETTRGGVLGGPASGTRTVYRRATN